jgi:hypothetical protein
MVTKHFLTTHHIRTRADLMQHKLAHQGELAAMQDALDAVAVMCAGQRTPQGDQMVATVRATMEEVKQSLAALQEAEALFEADHGGRDSPLV